MNPPTPSKISMGPPPPPPSNGKGSLMSKQTSKLKRSPQMGSLYRLLMDKFEGRGNSSNKKSSLRKSNSVGSSSKTSQGKADFLAEMMQNSSHFKKIEEDYQNYGSSILEVKSALEAFNSTNMSELLKFHQHVEDIFKLLTDEKPVLSRFEGFPFEKLDTLRLAAGTYLQLDGIVSTLKGWRLTAHAAKVPLPDQLDKIESYFTRIAEKVAAIEKTKEADTKKFQSQNITFDYTIISRIKEAMVDLSSSCIEMALKVSKDAKEAGKAAKLGRVISNILWRVFQFAFRVYGFAGGQDDRADRLASELAIEIQTY